VDQRTQPRSTHPIRVRSCLIPLDTFRGNYELGIEALPGLTVPAAFDKLALAL
jgi:hypothetical protein